LKKNLGMRDTAGFTLLELMATVLVVGIILGIGIPNFRAFTRNSDMAAAVNGLVSALHHSRTEALKRQSPVTICGSSDPLGAEPDCDGGEGGFFAFVDLDDLDGDGLADGDGAFDDGEPILLQRAAPSGTVKFFADGDSQYIAYGANGYLVTYAGLGDSATTFLFCDDRGNASAGNDESVARVVTVSGAGRPQLLRTQAEVEAAAGLTGGECN